MLCSAMIMALHVCMSVLSVCVCVYVDIVQICTNVNVHMHVQAHHTHLHTHCANDVLSTRVRVTGECGAPWTICCNRDVGNMPTREAAAGCMSVGST